MICQNTLKSISLLKTLKINFSANLIKRIKLLYNRANLVIKCKSFLSPKCSVILCGEILAAGIWKRKEHSLPSSNY